MILDTQLMTSSADRIDRPIIPATYDIRIIPNDLPADNASQSSAQSEQLMRLWQAIIDQWPQGMSASDPAITELVYRLVDTGVLPDPESNPIALTQFHEWIASMPTIPGGQQLVVEATLLTVWANSGDESPIQTIRVFDTWDAFNQVARYLYIDYGDTHDVFSAANHSVSADIALTAPTVDCYFQEWDGVDDPPSVDYTNAHTYIAINDADAQALDAWVSTVFPDGADHLSDADIVLQLMQSLQSDTFSYAPDNGDEWVSMATFLDQRQGDCEEFSHALWGGLQRVYDTLPDRERPHIRVIAGTITQDTFTWGHSVVAIDMAGGTYIADPTGAVVSTVADIPSQDQYNQRVGMTPLLAYTDQQTTCYVSPHELDGFATASAALGALTYSRLIADVIAGETAASAAGSPIRIGELSDSSATPLESTLNQFDQLANTLFSRATTPIAGGASNASFPYVSAPSDSLFIRIDHKKMQEDMSQFFFIQHQLSAFMTVIFSFADMVSSIATKLGGDTAVNASKQRQKMIQVFNSISSGMQESLMTLTDLMITSVEKLNDSRYQTAVNKIDSHLASTEAQLANGYLGNQAQIDGERLKANLSQDYYTMLADNRQRMQLATLDMPHFGSNIMPSQFQTLFVDDLKLQDSGITPLHIWALLFANGVIDHLGNPIPNTDLSTIDLRVIDYKVFQQALDNPAITESQRAFLTEKAFFFEKNILKMARDNQAALVNKILDIITSHTNQAQLGYGVFSGNDLNTSQYLWAYLDMMDQSDYVSPIDMTQAATGAVNQIHNVYDQASVTPLDFNAYETRIYGDGQSSRKVDADQIMDALIQDGILVSENGRWVIQTVPDSDGYSGHLDVLFGATLKGEFNKLAVLRYLQLKKGATSVVPSELMPYTAHPFNDFIQKYDWGEANVSIYNYLNRFSSFGNLTPNNFVFIDSTQARQRLFTNLIDAGYIIQDSYGDYVINKRPNQGIITSDQIQQALIADGVIREQSSGVYDIIQTKAHPELDELFEDRPDLRNGLITYLNQKRTPSGVLHLTNRASGAMESGSGFQVADTTMIGMARKNLITMSVSRRAAMTVMSAYIQIIDRIAKKLDESSSAASAYSDWQQTLAASHMGLAERQLASIQSDTIGMVGRINDLHKHRLNIVKLSDPVLRGLDMASSWASMAGSALLMLPSPAAQMVGIIISMASALLSLADSWRGYQLEMDLDQTMDPGDPTVITESTDALFSNAMNRQARSFSTAGTQWATIDDMPRSVVDYANAHTYLNPNDPAVQDLLTTRVFPDGIPPTVDAIVAQVHAFMVNQTTYEADANGDDWAAVGEVANRLSGDCEDLSNLEYSLLTAAFAKAGITDAQVSAEAGYVSMDSGRQGHVLVTVTHNNVTKALDPTLASGVPITIDTYRDRYDFDLVFTYDHTRTDIHNSEALGLATGNFIGDAVEWITGGISAGFDQFFSSMMPDLDDLDTLFEGKFNVSATDDPQQVIKTIMGDVLDIMTDSFGQKFSVNIPVMGDIVNLLKGPASDLIGTVTKPLADGLVDISINPLANGSVGFDFSGGIMANASQNVTDLVNGAVNVASEFNNFLVNIIFGTAFNRVEWGITDPNAVDTAQALNQNIHTMFQSGAALEPELPAANPAIQSASPITGVSIDNSKTIAELLTTYNAALNGSSGFFTNPDTLFASIDTKNNRKTIDAMAVGRHKDTIRCIQEQLRFVFEANKIVSDTIATLAARLGDTDKIKAVSGLQKIFETSFELVAVDMQLFDYLLSHYEQAVNHNLGVKKIRLEREVDSSVKTGMMPILVGFAKRGQLIESLANVSQTLMLYYDTVQKNPYSEHYIDNAALDGWVAASGEARYNAAVSDVLDDEKARILQPIIHYREQSFAILKQAAQTPPQKTGVELTIKWLGKADMEAVDYTQLNTYRDTIIGYGQRALLALMHIMAMYGYVASLGQSLRNDNAGFGADISGLMDVIEREINHDLGELDRIQSLQESLVRANNQKVDALKRVEKSVLEAMFISGYLMSSMFSSAVSSIGVIAVKAFANMFQGILLSYKNRNAMTDKLDTDLSTLSPMERRLLRRSGAVTDGADSLDVSAALIRNDYNNSAGSSALGMGYQSVNWLEQANQSIHIKQFMSAWRALLKAKQSEADGIQRLVTDSLGGVSASTAYAATLSAQVGLMKTGLSKNMNNRFSLAEQMVGVSNSFQRERFETLQQSIKLMGVRSLKAGYNRWHARQKTQFGGASVPKPVDWGVRISIEFFEDIFRLIVGGWRQLVMVGQKEAVEQEGDEAAAETEKALRRSGGGNAFYANEATLYSAAAANAASKAGADVIQQMGYYNGFFTKIINNLLDVWKSAAQNQGRKDVQGTERLHEESYKLGVALASKDPDAAQKAQTSLQNLSAFLRDGRHVAEPPLKTQASRTVMVGAQSLGRSIIGMFFRGKQKGFGGDTQGLTASTTVWDSIEQTRKQLIKLGGVDLLPEFDRSVMALKQDTEALAAAVQAATQEAANNAPNAPRDIDNEAIGSQLKLVQRISASFNTLAVLSDQVDNYRNERSEIMQKLDSIRHPQRVPLSQLAQSIERFAMQGSVGMIMRLNPYLDDASVHNQAEIIATMQWVQEQAAKSPQRVYRDIGDCMTKMSNMPSTKDTINAFFERSLWPLSGDRDPIGQSYRDLAMDVLAAKDRGMASTLALIERVSQKAGGDPSTWLINAGDGVLDRAINMGNSVGAKRLLHTKSHANRIARAITNPDDARAYARVFAQTKNADSFWTPATLEGTGIRDMSSSARWLATGYDSRFATIVTTAVNAIKDEPNSDNKRRQIRGLLAFADGLLAAGDDRGNEVLDALALSLQQRVPVPPAHGGQLNVFHRRGQVRRLPTIGPDSLNPADLTGLSEACLRRLTDIAPDVVETYRDTLTESVTANLAVIPQLDYAKVTQISDKQVYQALAWASNHPNSVPQGWFNTLYVRFPDVVTGILEHFPTKTKTWLADQFVANIALPTPTHKLQWLLYHSRDAQQAAAALSKEDIKWSDIRWPQSFSVQNASIWGALVENQLLNSPPDKQQTICQVVPGVILQAAVEGLVHQSIFKGNPPAFEQRTHHIVSVALQYQPDVALAAVNTLDHAMKQVLAAGRGGDFATAQIAQLSRVKRAFFKENAPDIAHALPWLLDVRPVISLFFTENMPAHQRIRFLRTVLAQNDSGAQRFYAALSGEQRAQLRQIMAMAEPPFSADDAMRIQLYENGFGDATYAALSSAERQDIVAQKHRANQGIHLPIPLQEDTNLCRHIYREMATVLASTDNSHIGITTTDLKARIDQDNRTLHQAIMAGQDPPSEDYDATLHQQRNALLYYQSTMLPRLKACYRAIANVTVNRPANPPQQEAAIRAFDHAINELGACADSSAHRVVIHTALTHYLGELDTATTKQILNAVPEGGGKKAFLQLLSQFAPAKYDELCRRMPQDAVHRDRIEERVNALVASSVLRSSGTDYRPVSELVAHMATIPHVFQDAVYGHMVHQFSQLMGAQRLASVPRLVEVVNALYPLAADSGEAHACTQQFFSQVVSQRISVPPPQSQALLANIHRITMVGGLPWPDFAGLEACVGLDAIRDYLNQSEVISRQDSDFLKGLQNRMILASNMINSPQPILSQKALRDCIKDSVRDALDLVMTKSCKLTGNDLSIFDQVPINPTLNDVAETYNHAHPVGTIPTAADAMGTPTMQALCDALTQSVYGQLTQKHIINDQGVINPLSNIRDLNYSALLNQVIQDARDKSIHVAETITQRDERSRCIQIAQKSDPTPYEKTNFSEDLMKLYSRDRDTFHQVVLAWLSTKKPAIPLNSIITPAVLEQGEGLAMIGEMMTVCSGILPDWERAFYKAITAAVPDRQTRLDTILKIPCPDFQKSLARACRQALLEADTSLSRRVTHGFGQLITAKTAQHYITSAAAHCLKPDPDAAIVLLKSLLLDAPGGDRSANERVAQRVIQAIVATTNPTGILDKLTRQLPSAKTEGIYASVAHYFNEGKPHIIWRNTTSLSHKSDKWGLQRLVRNMVDNMALPQHGQLLAHICAGLPRYGYPDDPRTLDIIKTKIRELPPNYVPGFRDACETLVDPADVAFLNEHLFTEAGVLAKLDIAKGQQIHYRMKMMKAHKVQKIQSVQTPYEWMTFLRSYQNYSRNFEVERTKMMPVSQASGGAGFN